MQLPKFKHDDLVETALGTKCRIKRFYTKNKINTYEVEILEGNNSGDTREFDENSLSFYYNMDKTTKDKTDIPSECPVCGSEWTISRFGMKKWYDCPKCNDKAENLCKKSKSSAKSLSKAWQQFKPNFHKDDFAGIEFEDVEYDTHAGDSYKYTFTVPESGHYSISGGNININEEYLDEIRESDFHRALEEEKNRLLKQIYEKYRINV